MIHPRDQHRLATRAIEILDAHAGKWIVCSESYVPLRPVHDDLVEDHQLGLPIIRDDPHAAALTFARFNSVMLVEFGGILSAQAVTVEEWAAAYVALLDLDRMSDADFGVADQIHESVNRSVLISITILLTLR